MTSEDTIEVPESALDRAMEFLRDDPALDSMPSDHNVAEAIVEVNDARDTEWPERPEWHE